MKKANLHAIVIVVVKYTQQVWSEYFISIMCCEFYMHFRNSQPNARGSPDSVD